MNKTQKIIVSLIVLSLIALPVVALGAASQEVDQPATIGTLTDLVSKIETVIWVVFGLIAVIMFVIAGILFLTASGSPEKIQAARSAAIWGVVGVVIGILAYSIVAIVNTFLA
jgi:hypothetical protein